MQREQALQLVNNWTKNPNLIKHMLAVEAQMRALAKHFGEDEDLWGVTGLLHDADYEMFKDDAIKHPSKIFEELQNQNADPRIAKAIKAHAWGHQQDAPMPENNMEWCLYCGDELSGYIIACALVRPDKKLESLNLESLKKKWNTKSFAAGAKRDSAEMVPDKLNLTLDQFMEICLNALKGISSELGL